MAHDYKESVEVESTSASARTGERPSLFDQHLPTRQQEILNANRTPNVGLSQNHHVSSQSVFNKERGVTREISITH